MRVRLGVNADKNKESQCQASIVVIFLDRDTGSRQNDAGRPASEFCTAI